jgi:hypothetical protein
MEEEFGIQFFGNFSIFFKDLNWKMDFNFF